MRRAFAGDRIFDQINASRILTLRRRVVGLLDNPARLCDVSVKFG